MSTRITYRVEERRYERTSPGTPYQLTRETIKLVSAADVSREVEQVGVCRALLGSEEEVTVTRLALSITTTDPSDNLRTVATFTKLLI